MQCERCGAPREDNASVCVRCGNKFPQPSSCEDASIPSIDSFGDNSRPNQVTPHVDPSAQEVAPVQAGAPSHIDSADAIEPVFNPTIASAVNPVATTVNPAATPAAAPVASPVSPVASPSPQASGSVSGTQNSHATSFFASKKNRNLAFIGAAIVVVLVIAFNVFNYFSGLIGPNDVKQILSSDQELMQDGIVSSRYVAQSTYTVKNVVVEEQEDVTAETHNKGYVGGLGAAGKYGKPDDKALGATATNIVCARVKATIVNDNFETTFTTYLYVTKTSQGWKSLAPIFINPMDATTTPLKGVDKSYIYSYIYSSEEECSGSDLQNNNGTYTSTMNVTSHDENWYGDTDYSWSDVYTFSNDKGWTLDHSTKDDPTIKVNWNMKGKTYEYVHKSDYYRNENVSLTINDINNKTADISYSISSEPASSSSSAKSVNLSGRTTATIKAKRGGNISIELNDANNGVTITISDGEKKRVAGRGEVNALVVSIDTQSDDGSWFPGKYSYDRLEMIEKAQ